MVAALCAVTIAASDSAGAGPAELADPTPNTCDWRTVHRHMNAGKADVDRAFEPSADRRLRQTKAWQPHKFCLVRKHDRKRIGEYVDEAQRAARVRMESHHYRELVRAVTPFVCGFGRSAIPCAIVYCESGGSWTAYNPSGAVSLYQLLGKGAPFPIRSKWDKLEHHRIAFELYAGGAGRSHWVC